VPLYEYECVSCGSFEMIRKFSDRPLKKCPKCGGKVEKQLSAPAIQFKGTGWYITDYAKKSGGAEKTGSDSGGEKKPAADPGGEKKAESKTEAGVNKAEAPAKKDAAPKGKPG